MPVDHPAPTPEHVFPYQSPDSFVTASNSCSPPEPLLCLACKALRRLASGEKQRFSNEIRVLGARPRLFRLRQTRPPSRGGLPCPFHLPAAGLEEKYASE